MAAHSADLSLAFTELRVADWAPLVRWYVEVLGLKRVLEDVEHRFALLQAGRGRIALKGGGPPDGEPRVRLVFEVEDVEAERTRLVALGVVFGPPLENPREGYRSVEFHDPEGTPLTLFSWCGGATAAESHAPRPR